MVAEWMADIVSTHSRPKAAGTSGGQVAVMGGFQLTAARRRLVNQYGVTLAAISFNSQPPEGGWASIKMLTAIAYGFQLTAARRRLGDDFNGQIGINRFQLTAARRRLGGLFCRCPCCLCFNSQPPEGGWRKRHV